MYRFITFSPFVTSDDVARIVPTPRYSSASPARFHRVGALRGRTTIRWTGGGDRMVTGIVRVLGPVQFVDGSDNVVELPSVSLRRLLAVLALSRENTLRGEYLGDLLGLPPG